MNLRKILSIREIADATRRVSAPSACVRAMVALALATLSCAGLRGADITVCVINGKTGRPLRNVEVGLVGANDSSAKEGKTQVFQGGEQKVVPLPKTWVGRTDAQGRVNFNIASPPDRLVANLDVKLCERHQMYYYGETTMILRQGVVGPNQGCDPKGKVKASFTPKPGEWVMFGTPHHWWQTHLPDLLGP